MKKDSKPSVNTSKATNKNTWLSQPKNPQWTPQSSSSTKDSQLMTLRRWLQVAGKRSPFSSHLPSLLVVRIRPKRTLRAAKWNSPKRSKLYRPKCSTFNCWGFYLNSRRWDLVWNRLSKDYRCIRFLKTTLLENTMFCWRS